MKQNNVLFFFVCMAGFLNAMQQEQREGKGSLARKTTLTSIRDVGPDSIRKQFVNYAPLLKKGESVEKVFSEDMAIADNTFFYTYNREVFAVPCNFASQAIKIIEHSHFPNYPPRIAVISSKKSGWLLASYLNYFDTTGDRMRTQLLVTSKEMIEQVTKFQNLKSSHQQPRCVTDYPLTDNIQKIKFNPTGDMLAIAHATCVRFLYFARNKIDDSCSLHCKHGANITDIDFDDTGKHLLVVWDDGMLDRVYIGMEKIGITTDGPAIQIDTNAIEAIRYVHPEMAFFMSLSGIKKFDLKSFMSDQTKKSVDDFIQPFIKRGTSKRQYECGVFDDSKNEMDDSGATIMGDEYANWAVAMWTKQKEASEKERRKIIVYKKINDTVMKCFHLMVPKLEKFECFDRKGRRSFPGYIANVVIHGDTVVCLATNGDIYKWHLLFDVDSQHSEASTVIAAKPVLTKSGSNSPTTRERSSSRSKFYELTHHTSSSHNVTEEIDKMSSKNKATSLFGLITTTPRNNRKSGSHGSSPHSPTSAQTSPHTDGGTPAQTPIGSPKVYSPKGNFTGAVGELTHPVGEQRSVTFDNVTNLVHVNNAEQETL